jgi:hypothetical protein
MTCFLSQFRLTFPAVSGTVTAVLCSDPPQSISWTRFASKVSMLARLFVMSNRSALLWPTFAGRQIGNLYGYPVKRQIDTAG